MMWCEVFQEGFSVETLEEAFWRTEGLVGCRGKVVDGVR